MGNWAEVQCACPNRTRLPGSDPYFDRPHRKKHRLTKLQSAEVEEWKQTREDMFACGHRGGLVIELWPGEIIHLGHRIARIFGSSTFEVFAKVGDWRCYEDELLLIQPGEASQWLSEIEEIHKVFDGWGDLPEGELGRLVLEICRDDLNSRLDFEARLDEIEAKMPMTGVVPLKRNLEQWKRPDIQSTIQKIMKALADAAKLCRASIETGNPIRLLW